MLFRRTRREHVTDYFNVVHANHGAWLRNFLYLGRSREVQAYVEFLESVNIFFLANYYAGRRFDPYLAYLSKALVFPLALIATLLSAIMAWVQLYNEYRITNFLRRPTLAKAVVETLIFFSTCTAVLGGVLAGAIFLPSITPMLFVGSFALKAVWDFGCAAGHCHRIFFGNISPVEQQENKKSVLQSLLSGLSNVAIAVSTGVLALTPANFVVPLTCVLIASLTGATIALRKRYQTQDIDLVRTSSSTAQTINGLDLDLHPQVRNDLVYGLESGFLRSALPTTVDVEINLAAPPAPIQPPPPAPVINQAAGQRANGAFRL